MCYPPDDDPLSWRDRTLLLIALAILLAATVLAALAAAGARGLSPEAWGFVLVVVGAAVAVVGLLLLAVAWRRLRGRW